MDATVILRRDQLAAFLKDHQSIKAFEQALKIVSTTTENFVASDETAQELEIEVGTAQASANQALAVLAKLADVLQLLALAPPVQIIMLTDDVSPPIQVGTLGQQQADHVAITGGTVNLPTGLQIGAFTATPIANTGFITVQDSGGTNRRLMVG